MKIKGTFESVTFPVREYWKHGEEPERHTPEGSLEFSNITEYMEHLYLNYKCAYCGWTILQVDPVDGPFYSRVVFDKKGREEVQDFCSETCWQEKRMRDK